MNTFFPILTIAAGVFLFSCKNEPANQKVSADETSSESKRLNVFLDKVFDEAVDRDPMRQSYLGIKKDYDKWPDISDERSQKEQEIAIAELDSLKKNFDFNKLDEQSKISYKLFEYNSNQQIKNFKFRFDDYPTNQMDGWHSNLPAFLINIHQIADTSDAKAYIKRLNGVDKLFDQLIVQLKIREEKNIIPPKFVFPYVLTDCRNVLTGKPFSNDHKSSTLLEDFTNKINKLNLDKKRAEELIADASQALLTSVKPAYEKLIAYTTQLEKKATEDDGCWKFPDGDEFYNAALERTTTTNLTADEIHEIGLKEVARIQGEMKEIMKKVHFKNDNLQDFFKFMREDKQFYFSNDSAGKKAYMAKAVEIINTMKAQLDKLFVTQPKAPIEVKAVEAFREKSATGAFYEEPALDGSRPGRYYINLYTMQDQPIYQMEALAYHEGIPGHHMQIAIAQELKNMPKFRKNGGNTAYQEGWALYSEQLGKEIGFYSDPYSDFGRLSMEIFRAARLVVDTGIHRKKWSRKKAIDYFLANIPNPEGDCIKEIERYIVWPSQATGYKIGMLKILELREKAKKELGDKFSLKEFHEVILTNGPLPLSLLEENVNNWIKSKT